MKRVLVANRGEIAVRVIRACREWGVESVAVYSEVDREAPHVSLADSGVLLEHDSPLQAYLDVENILEAARRSGADAIHPGYGFLSENAVFAHAVEDAGFVFVGPTGKTIEQMGSKTEARTLMEAAGVPVVPGYQGDCDDMDAVRTAAENIGYPVLVKAAFGGGGKGMRVVRDAPGLEEAVASAQREAISAFGDGRVFLEKFVEGPSHVEVQILGDGQGNVVHLGERECSVQRRHQKVIEECPAGWITEETRGLICEAGVKAAQAVEYRGAGTVEFLVERSGAFYFLEMNTRLQVEHPVTECVFGRDLVAAQLHVADSGSLPFSQEDLQARGHSIEARIYAESPEKGFMPSIGKLLRVDFPEGPGVRIDSGIRTGMEITVHYDPMIAKLIVTAESRTAAIRKMRTALADTVIHGVENNIGLLLRILDSSVFEKGEVHTRWLDEEGAVLWDGHSANRLEVLAAWAAAPCRTSIRATSGGSVDAPSTHSPWESLSGWRMNSRGLHE